MKNRWILPCVCAFTAAAIAAASAVRPAAPMPSRIVERDQARQSSHDWGELRQAFGGETFGVKDLVAGEVTLKPGQQMHPPHEHAEEQFIVILDGSGTWHLNGKDQPAKPGDVGYAAPWDRHDLKNTGDAPLKFFLFKWGYKGVEPPAKPDSRR